MKLLNRYGTQKVILIFVGVVVLATVFFPPWTITFVGDKYGYANSGHRIEWWGVFSPPNDGTISFGVLLVEWAAVCIFGVIAYLTMKPNDKP